jgi:hypothetical protein
MSVILGLSYKNNRLRVIENRELRRISGPTWVGQEEHLRSPILWILHPILSVWSNQGG